LTPAGQVLHQVEERRLGPLEVVENDDDGTAPPQPFQEPANGPERLLQPRHRTLDSHHGRDPLFDQRTVLGSGDDGVDLGAGFDLRVVVGDAACVLHELGHRPEGDALPVRQAPAHQDEGFGLEA